jgi:hypothetical protein
MHGSANIWILMSEIFFTGIFSDYRSTVVTLDHLHREGGPERIISLFSPIDSRINIFQSEQDLLFHFHGAIPISFGTTGRIETRRD